MNVELDDLFCSKFVNAFRGQILDGCVGYRNIEAMIKEGAVYVGIRCTLLLGKKSTINSGKQFDKNIQFDCIVRTLWSHHNAKTHTIILNMKDAKEEPEELNLDTVAHLLYSLGTIVSSNSYSLHFLRYRLKFKKFKKFALFKSLKSKENSAFYGGVISLTNTKANK